MDQLAEAVKVTLGPKGRNVVIDKKFGAPTVTKDGVTVAKEIELPRPDREHGRADGEGSRDQDLRPGRRRHHHRDGAGAGDLPRRPEERHGGRNPMALKRGIDKAVERVVEELKKISVPTAGKKEIAQVGTISANNDKEIGDLIADAMEKVGKDGVITVEEAKGLETDAGDGGRHAVRPRLPLAVLRHRSGQDGSGARGRATSSSTTRRSRR